MSRFDFESVDSKGSRTHAIVRNFNSLPGRTFNLRIELIMRNPLMAFVILPLLKFLIQFQKRFPFLSKYIKQIEHLNYKTLPNLEVLHESQHFIVINKEADIVINDDDRARVSVEHQLMARFPELANNSLRFKFYFAHRLDYSTSGVLCIAKSKNACSAAVAAFASRTTQKYYLAILRGHLSINYLAITDKIGSDKVEKHKMATECMPNCSDDLRPAETHLLVLEKGFCYGYPATKVLLRPITGRRHQLRLHCASIGHTIVGDCTYSSEDDGAPYRMYLHAFKIIIPTKLENLDVVSPDPFLPEDARNCWRPMEIVMSIEDGIHELTSENQ